MPIAKLFCVAPLAAGLLVAADSHTLVTPDWIEQRRSDASIVILDARPETEYKKGHIPGALPINAYDNLVESTPQGEKVFQDWLTDTFSRLGLGPKDQIVVYENKVGMRAARAYWMLCYAGQPTVYMLEGGFEGWKAKQLPVSTDPPVARTATKYKLKPQKKYVATAQEVAALSKEKKVVILDVRRRDEFEGKGGSEDCARQGHIPGAVWIEWTQFLSEDGSTIQAPEKLGVMLAEKGVTPDKQIITYCHRGARSAMVWAVFDDMGYPKVKNYVGSWHDWAAKKELPAQ